MHDATYFSNCQRKSVLPFNGHEMTELLENSHLISNAGGRASGGHLLVESAVRGRILAAAAPGLALHTRHRVRARPVVVAEQQLKIPSFIFQK